jgi:hypothetical protein
MGTISKALILTLVVAGLLLAGCTTPAIQQTAPTLTATPTKTPRPEFAPGLEGTVESSEASAYMTAEAAQLQLYLDGLEADRLAIGARSDAATAEAKVRAADAEATRAWELVTAEAERTRHALEVETTRVALDAISTREALASQATAQAMSQDATATAVSANTTATAVSAQYTAQAEGARATATAVAVIQEIEAATLERERLDLARDQAWQGIKTVVPWLLLALFVAALGWVGYNYVIVWRKRQSIMKRDQRGDAPLYLQDGENGGVRIIDVDRSAGPVTVVEGDVIEVPEVSKPAVQERTVARDQEVDRVTRCLPGQAKRPQRQQQALPQGNQRPAHQEIEIEVLDDPPTEVIGWIEEVLPKMIESGEETNDS